METPFACFQFGDSGDLPDRAVTILKKHRTDTVRRESQVSSLKPILDEIPHQAEQLHRQIEELNARISPWLRFYAGTSQRNESRINDAA